MSSPDDDLALASLAALHEPLRRRLYGYVVGQADAVGRDQAAAAVGVARSVAAFHLDKLAEVGLLEVEFRRPPGRGGPGAGRPAKLYRRGAQRVSLSLPDRRYELAGRLLAEGVARSESEDSSPAEAARRAANEHGRNAGRAAATTAGRPGASTAAGIRRRSGELDAVVAALAAEGYEPRVEDRSVVLGNCPFHELAEAQRDLVCGMNVELIDGLLTGMGAKGLEARLDPAPGRCCVRVEVRRRRR